MLMAPCRRGLLTTSSLARQQVNTYSIIIQVQIYGQEDNQKNPNDIERQLLKYIKQNSGQGWVVEQLSCQRACLPKNGKGFELYTQAGTFGVLSASPSLFLLPPLSSCFPLSLPASPSLLHFLLSPYTVKVQRSAFQTGWGGGVGGMEPNQTTTKTHGILLLFLFYGFNTYLCREGFLLLPFNDQPSSKVPKYLKRTSFKS